MCIQRLLHLTALTVAVISSLIGALSVEACEHAKISKHVTAVEVPSPAIPDSETPYSFSDGDNEFSLSAITTHHDPCAGIAADEMISCPTEVGVHDHLFADQRVFTTKTTLLSSHVLLRI